MLDKGNGFDRDFGESAPLYTPDLGVGTVYYSIACWDDIYIYFGMATYGQIYSGSYIRRCWVQLTVRLFELW